MKYNLAISLFSLFILGCNSCENSSTDTGTSTDSNTSTDEETGSNTDTDTDTDSDADTDTDTDTEVVPGSWITIPAGSFWMGSPDGNCPKDYPGGVDCEEELGRWIDEDLHYVTLTRSFEIYSTELTQRQWEEVIGWNSSFFGPDSSLYFCGLDCPVEKHGSFDALVYANEISKKAGFTPCFILTDIECHDHTKAGTDAFVCMNGEQMGIKNATVTLNKVKSVYDCEGYRLLTESEWEYAMRAGSITAFYPSKGNDGTITVLENDPNQNQIGWSHPIAEKRTHIVGQKEPNAWGLYDFSGNIAEWTWDAYEESYPSGDTASPVVDPEGPPWTADGQRVMRGGAWDMNAGYCRSARRLKTGPGARFPMIGFRLARTLP